MLASIDDANKKKVIGLFEARNDAEENHKLTMQGYAESFKDVAKELGITPTAIGKEYSDYKFSLTKPEIIEERDTLHELVFES